MAKKKLPKYLLIVWQRESHPNMMDFNKAISLGYKMFQYLPSDYDDRIVAAVMKPLTLSEQSAAVKKFYTGE